jgi:hypothetical protein
VRKCRQNVAVATLNSPVDLGRFLPLRAGALARTRLPLGLARLRGRVVHVPDRRVTAARGFGLTVGGIRRSSHLSDPSSDMPADTFMDAAFNDLQFWKLRGMAINVYANLEQALLMVMSLSASSG